MLSVLGLAIWTVGIAAQPASAATLTVTKTADTADGTCDADCSLREAIIAANGTVQADTIDLPAGYYGLTIPGVEEAGFQGDLDILADLTIRAIGGAATIDGNQLDRVLHIVNGDWDVSLADLTITGGSSTGGGGIAQNGYGTLTLSRVIVAGNQVPESQGGGMYLIGALVMRDSTVGYNIASNGGGLSLGLRDVLIERSSIVGNQSGWTGSGGGIISGYISPERRIRIDRTRIENNSAADDGGGMYLSGDTLVMTRSTVSGNSTVSDGGGLYSGSAGMVEITTSTLAGNASTNGGGIESRGDLEVNRSTISGNRAGLDGGGIRAYTNGGSLDVTNTTISENRAGDDGGGISSGGTGSGTQAAIASTTIVGNQSDIDFNTGGDGGGIFSGLGSLSLSNSIVVDNQDGPGTTYADCAGTIASGGYNIMKFVFGCSGFTGTNDTVADTAYDPLAFEGGLTETHALPQGSSAAMHGPTGGACDGFDQRGMPRTSPCSTGAYEQAFCDGVLVNVVGSGGGDSLRGTAGADGIAALGGSDTVRAGAGNDRVCGGSGNDRLLGEGGSDDLLGGSGNDFMDGGSGSDVCVGGQGRDRAKSC